MSDEHGESGRFRVHLQTNPSPGLEFYEGHVDVWAECAGVAPARAVRELRRTSFPDRGASCWKVTKVERLP